MYKIGDHVRYLRCSDPVNEDYNETYFEKGSVYEVLKVGESFPKGYVMVEVYHSQKKLFVDEIELAYTEKLNINDCL